MIATKTIAKLLSTEYRKQRKERKNLSWFDLASVVRLAVVKSLKKRGTVLRLVDSERK